MLGYYETLSDGGENNESEHRILPEDTIENRPQAPHPTKFTNRARENVNPKVAVCSTAERMEEQIMPGNVRTVGTILVHTDTNNKTENAESQHSKSTRQIQALDPKKDIGPHADRIASENISSLNNMESMTQEALDEIYKIHGFHQVSRGKLDFSPPWLLEQSFKK